MNNTKTTKPTAVVTGGNRGLGLETCRQLLARGSSVILTARDRDKAATAAGSLAGAGGGDITPMALDVSDAASVQRFAAALGGVLGDRSLDILVNNAGVALNGFDAEVVKSTLAVNTHGAIAVTEALLPRMSRDGVIVMVSSGLGALADVHGTLRARFTDPALDRAGLRALTDEFLRAVENGTHGANHWPSSAYNVSKVALNAYVRLLSRERSSPRVVAVCPGWVRTDMGGQHASRSVEEGARGITWAATPGADGPRGGFFRDGEAIDW